LSCVGVADVNLLLCYIVSSSNATHAEYAANARKYVTNATGARAKTQG